MERHKQPVETAKQLSAPTIRNNARLNNTSCPPIPKVPTRVPWPKRRNTTNLHQKNARGSLSLAVQQVYYIPTKPRTFLHNPEIMVNISSTVIVNALLATSAVSAFTSPFVKSPRQVAFARKIDTSLNAEDKLAKDVTGAELEVMLTEWDQPLVLDAYATWCGPCLLVSLCDIYIES